MIEIFEGRLGGGKTLYAVERMVRYLGVGGRIYSNIELNVDAVREYLRRKFRWELQEGQYTLLQDEEISLFHRFTSGGEPGKPTLVVIDEAHIWLNARDWASASRELLTFLTQSRKTHTDIIFISQSAFNIDKQIMRLVQYIWRFRDLSQYVIPGLGIRWPINQFLRVQCDYDGRTVLQRYFVRKDKELYKLYNTFNLLRTFDRLENVKEIGDGRIVERKKNMWKMILAGAVGVVGFLVWRYWDVGFFEKLTGKPRTVQVQQASVPIFNPTTSSDEENDSMQDVVYRVIQYCPSTGKIICVIDQNGYMWINKKVSKLGLVRDITETCIFGTSLDGEPFKINRVFSGFLKSDNQK